MTSRSVLPSAQPSRARRLVRSMLGDASEESQDMAQILVSELVNNALVHGMDAATLVVEVDEKKLHVEVLDSRSDTDLHPLPLDTDREDGRGLAIVDALATGWGVEPRHVGKAVWFDLELKP